MESLKLIVLLIVVGFGLIVVLTQFLASGVTRGVIVGWICLVFSLCVFVAPLGVLVSVKLFFFTLAVGLAMRLVHYPTFVFYGTFCTSRRFTTPASELD